MTMRIGVLGGISSASTAEYYRRLAMETTGNGECAQQEVVVLSLDFARFNELELAPDLAAYIDYIVDGLNSLIAAGAECLLMAANSPHAVLRAIEDRIRLPVIDIVSETASQAAIAGISRPLILGITATIQSGMYEDACKNEGMAPLVPGPTDQALVDTIIFGELCTGNATEQSRLHMTQVIARYPVDGVILACTELPLLLDEEGSTLPMVNSARVHCEAALRLARR